MTVALSRARLGLYILGRREVFEACYELKDAFEHLFQRPDKLTLVTGELWPTERIAASVGSPAVPGEVCMEGVEHLGQYVYEMTQTRIKQLEADGAVVQAAEALGSIDEAAEGYVEQAEDDDEPEVEEVDENGPEN
jgi:intron-binding protein aquarius